MNESAYAVRGFLTIRSHSLRVPLSGVLAVRVDPETGTFAGDLELRQSTVSRTILGVRLLRATVQITADSPVTGRIDHDNRLTATVTVNASITALRVCGRTVLSGGHCRTATPAVVPLRSQPGFDWAQGGRMVGGYCRPPFTGGGRMTSAINLLAAGPGNAAVIDLIPRPA